MGKRGPTPQPKHLAKAKGVYRPSRHDSLADENKFRWVREYIDPPEFLDETGQLLWDQKIKEAVKHDGWIAYVHLTEVALYCWHLQEQLRYMAEPGTTLDERGNLIINPSRKLVFEHAKMAKAIGSGFGFTSTGDLRNIAQMSSKEVETTTNQFRKEYKI